MDPLAEEFTTFNRQRELDRLERERKEKEWEQELMSAMEASGSSNVPTATSSRQFRLSDSQLPNDYGTLGKESVPRPIISSEINNPVATSGHMEMSCVKPELETSGSSKMDNSIQSKKHAWTKRRSTTVPEGAKIWQKSSWKH